MDARLQGFETMGGVLDCDGGPRVTPAVSQNPLVSKPMGFEMSHQSLEAGGVPNQAQGANRPTEHDVTWC